jgi:hypothetical protein
MQTAWQRDAQNFPNIRLVVAWSTKRRERLDLLKSDADIVVTNFDTFRNCFKEICAAGFQRFIIDESSAVKNFKEFQRSLTGKELTRFAMKCMSAMSYINLRPNGGVYFVPRSKAESLESITKFFAELSQYKASSAPMIFSSAPVPNCPVQRDQIAEGVNMTVNSDIDQMIGKLADLREEIGSVRESTLSKKAEAVAELRQKAAMYSKILETENETLAARLDLLDQTIDALFDKHAEEQAKKTA